MRRIVALAVAVGAFAVGAGCRHTAGTCDCSHHPDNNVLPPIGNPYPALGQPIPGTTVPERMPAPAPVAPPTAPGR